MLFRNFLKKLIYKNVVHNPYGLNQNHQRNYTDNVRLHAYIRFYLYNYFYYDMRKYMYDTLYNSEHTYPGIKHSYLVSWPPGQGTLC